ncbi:YfiT family bacillithiol transferase [Ammoniphilus sp. CFH 90114]|uniref:YfiT family bacillithiol transferase n=1 Tax=Ammoniphilus sp. CFH 90114 TaxID=2493665 RepID=UPI00100E6450|nr:bacillithiol transferase BstA [Ammoniphilus sp. CFH 90114]RXT06370.1 putative metal-dependent hydrolase [Ammoniphilus sp. CFH 90114]
MMDVRYPVGHYSYEEEVTDKQLQVWIDEIEAAPARLRETVIHLSDEQLSTPYRPGGWTIRQVVHHLADSHVNSYVRFKLALTEDVPTIKPYAEDRWAELHDSTTSILVSLDLLDALHKRWVILLRSLNKVELNRTFHHPDTGRISLKVNIGLYAWHGRHHIAHITSIKEKMGW